MGSRSFSKKEEGGLNLLLGGGGVVRARREKVEQLAPTYTRAVQDIIVIVDIQWGANCQS